MYQHTLSNTFLEADTKVLPHSWYPISACTSTLWPPYNSSWDQLRILHTDDVAYAISGRMPFSRIYGYVCPLHSSITRYSNLIYYLVNNVRLRHFYFVVQQASTMYTMIILYVTFVLNTKTCLLDIIDGSVAVHLIWIGIYNICHHQRNTQSLSILVYVPIRQHLMVQIQCISSLLSRNQTRLFLAPFTRIFFSSVVIRVSFYYHVQIEVCIVVAYRDYI